MSEITDILDMPKTLFLSISQDYFSMLLPPSHYCGNQWLQRYAMFGEAVNHSQSTCCIFFAND